jgi:hypothetical protein
MQSSLLRSHTAMAVHCFGGLLLNACLELEACHMLFSTGCAEHMRQLFL